MDATTPWDDLGLTGGCWGDAAESIPAENTSRSPEASELIQLRSWSHSIEIPDRHRKQWPPTHTHDLQAAQALTSLSHSPFGTFEHDGSVDCCRPCDRQCDPNEIFECFSIDTEPCYDANCEQTCEFDGVNTLCNDTHLNNVNDILCCLHEGCSFRAFSEQELLHHCTITHACGGRTQRECRNQFIPSSNWVQTHVHNEHCKDGFINPLLLHPDGCSSKSFSLGEHQTYNNHNFSYPSQNEEIYGELQEIASFGQKPCCHDPNRTGPCIQDGLRHVEKARVGAKQIGQASKASSPETFTATASSEVTCPSPTSSTNLNGLDKLVNNSSSAGQIFACCWISEQGSSGPCSLAFKSALELQTHIEDSHLALSECPSNSRNGERIICRWQGCPFAQTKKRWRQVQHLKDHVRTHSKREWLLIVLDAANMT